MKEKIEIYSTAYLLEDLAGTPFVKGDVGVVAEVYEHADMYEIEFFSIDGSTLSVEPVPGAMLRSCKGIRQVPHVIGLAA